MNLETAKALASPQLWNEKNLQALSAWEELTILKPLGLTLNSYSTVRFISQNPQASRKWLLHESIGSFLPFGIEEIPDDFSYIALEQGATLSKFAWLNFEETVSLIRSACKLISDISPELYNSIQYLLRSFHLIESPGKEIDVSFSLPELPNSIFLSYPSPTESFIEPRIAEAIIHEVLHLQLTLIEYNFPLIDPTLGANEVYSPWRDELRPEIGVVHAIFVFRNLEIFWTRVKQNHQYFNFAKERIKDIAEQFNSLKSDDLNTLTPFGKFVVKILLSGRDDNYY